MTDFELYEWVFFNILCTYFGVVTTIGIWVVAACSAAVLLTVGAAFPIYSNSSLNRNWILLSFEFEETPLQIKSDNHFVACLRNSHPKKSNKKIRKKKF